MRVDWTIIDYSFDHSCDEEIRLLYHEGVWGVVVLESGARIFDYRSTNREKAIEQFKLLKGKRNASK